MIEIRSHIQFILQAGKRYDACTGNVRKSPDSPMIVMPRRPPVVKFMYIAETPELRLSLLLL
jgi:hypothetical protein